MAISVAIIEDHVEFRQSIAFILQSTEGFLCAGAYGSVEEALLKLGSPNVILLDINLPGMSGTDGIPRIKERCPDSRILMLTVFDDDRHVFHAILAGADGYILKKTPPLRLLQAVEDVVIGGAPMTPSVARQAIAMFKQYVPIQLAEDPLTNREREILSLLVEGVSTEEIAEKLFISQFTIRNHIRHVYEKLHVHSKSQAVVKALREGLV